MDILDAAQRRSRRTMHQWMDARELKRTAASAANAGIACALCEASKRDAVRAELARAQARLAVLERMLRDVGDALARHDAADAIVSANAPHWSHVAIVARAEALGVLLANVAIAVRVACQTPVVQERA